MKLEWENPTGSVKDRMAQTVIARAEEDGRLERGDTVVEYTGGSTGTSLALVCAAKGYRIRVVTSDAFSGEKLDHMAALGAELTLVPSEGGGTTRKLILEMIEAARTLSREPHTYWTDQLNNHDSIAGHYPLGEENWSQTKRKVDAFVHCVGTAASSRGVATVVKRYKPGMRMVVVEPAESSVLRGGQAGAHKIEGVGIGFTPPLWEPALVDDDRSGQHGRREGDGAAPCAGRRRCSPGCPPARTCGPDPDRRASGAGSHGHHADGRLGLKYLSTDVYRAGP